MNPQFQINSNFNNQDSIDYLPLKIGNYWEYWDNWSYPEPTGYYIKVIADSMMSNGKTYKVLESKWLKGPIQGTYYFYFRSDSNKIFRYYPIQACTGSEYVYFDFTIIDKNLWSVCEFEFEGYYKSCDSTYYQFYEIFGRDITSKAFIYAKVVNNDTIKQPFGTPTLMILAKGIGIAFEVKDNLGRYPLTGAIINDTIYGVITSLLDEKYEEEQNLSSVEIFPNPFNGQTTINLEFTDEFYGNILIFNLLGEKVHEFAELKYSKGQHQISFDASKLTSGVYYLNLISNNKLISKKFIVIK